MLQSLPMRAVLLLFTAGWAAAQQPILYNRGAVNAASLAPFGLPNAALARGGILSVFGEHLGPAQSPALSFPLSTTLGGVSLTITEGATVTQLYPIYVSPGQINAILPSTVSAGLATLRLVSNGAKSNAITIQVSNSAPGIFAVSSGGFGPGIIQNYISTANQPINSSIAPAAPGQVITIWGTGLGPVTFPDNVAPTAGNVAAPVTVTIGGQAAAVAYSGRTPCCSGVDQVVATVPANAPLGCWVPMVVNAGGVVSNTATLAIAAPGASSCNDPGNPLSALVRTPGSQAFIHLERVDSVQNNTASPVLKTVDNLYSRFYTRPDSPYNFDPYLSYPPPGSCLVHQTSGDSFYDKSLRGALPAGASLNPQPNQTYNNGTQTLTLGPVLPFYSSMLGGTVNANPIGMALLGAGAKLTIDPSGVNLSVPLKAAASPGWSRPNAIIVIPRSSPLNLSFTPGDPAAPTAILIYSYAAANNATVEVQCLAAPGATSFTISPDTLANLPATYRILDGSYTNLFVGTLGVNNAVPFSNSLASNGLVVNSYWLAQSAVIQ